MLYVCHKTNAERFALRFLSRKTESILLHVEKLCREDGILTWRRTNHSTFYAARVPRGRDLVLGLCVSSPMCVCLSFRCDMHYHELIKMVSRNLDTPQTRRLSFTRYIDMVTRKQRLLGADSAGRYSGNDTYHNTYNHVLLHTHFSIFFVGSRVQFVRGSKFRPKQNIKYDFCYFVCNFWCFGV